ncbi:uncharacterized protein G2W53_031530 [Senna tora]|uniref:Uncharacterized protein n=1 Tax=Senna tora TaxID=362788 RepID=A0A834TAS0_9FABA|nr:uncharacterized protein G2W53_031530 [Senna tora]
MGKIGISPKVPVAFKFQLANG